jgi:hypothetical protein
MRDPFLKLAKELLATNTFAAGGLSDPIALAVRPPTRRSLSNPAIFC